MCLIMYYDKKKHWVGEIIVRCIIKLGTKLSIGPYSSLADSDHGFFFYSRAVERHWFVGKRDPHAVRFFPYVLLHSILWVSRFQGTGESEGRPFTYEELYGDVLTSSMNRETLWEPSSAKVNLCNDCEKHSRHFNPSSYI
jgi:hypothetical protein